MLHLIFAIVLEAMYTSENAVDGPFSKEEWCERAGQFIGGYALGLFGEEVSLGSVVY